MKKTCISRFFSLLKMALKRTFHLWRTMSSNSTFVECNEHKDCTKVTVEVHTSNVQLDAESDENI